MLTICKNGGGNLRNKPSKRGFTLIELLAVIVILAIIALIAIPQVIKILNKARISAAEDTTSGIVKSAENYVADFMLKNNGELPNENLVFNCNNAGCSLTNILENYNLEGLTELDFKGTKPESGKVTISNNGQKISISNLKINEFNCYYPSSNGGTNCNNNDPIENIEYTSGDAINVAGYNWHVISDYNGYLTLLMDANQLGANSDMAHCKNDLDSSTDCGVDESGQYLLYSWDKSLIRNYLNNDFLADLETKISNEIVPTQICIDPSNGEKTTYGGYLKEEINLINNASCDNGYVEDYVRLISVAEYVNMSPYYSGNVQNYPNISEIIKLSGNDYTNWFYCKSGNCGTNPTDPTYWTVGRWWTMSSYSQLSKTESFYATRTVTYNGLCSNIASFNSIGVRPVITIKK